MPHQVYKALYDYTPNRSDELELQKDNLKPDYIVGITRGGNIPATIISNMTGIRCEAIKVSLRDDSKLESNTWMAKDALGREI